MTFPAASLWLAGLLVQSGAPSSTRVLVPQEPAAVQQAAVQQAAAKPGPWRLDTALSTPQWLTLSGQQRTRYETLHNQFRANLSGDDDVLALRTSLRADLDFAPFGGTLEILDSRTYWDDDQTPLDTTQVNALDILQAWAGYRWQDVLAEGDEAHLLGGRHTMDIGSRRFVARNAYRNTINAFTGLNATLDSESGKFWRAFFVLPTNRLPSDFDELDDNEIELDDETFDVRFWGLFGSTPDLLSNVAGEAYYYGLDEQDGGDLATRDRSLHTFGARVFRDPAPGAIDFEVETAYQFGESRATASGADTTDLDHSAHFEHVALGYTFDANWSPRLILQVDHASGDDDPTDGDNERFDTLFGARRFELGPTGIWGAFARSNMFSPGLRLEAKPTDRLSVMVADRFHYLASDRDAWTSAGVRDVTGGSGSYVGNQLESAVRYDVVPKSFTVEIGFAYLFEGSFMEDAPNSNGAGDASYAYLQTTFSF